MAARGSMQTLLLMKNAPVETVQQALTHKINVFVDDPKVRFEEVRATDGVVDVVVWDAATTNINNTYVYGFKPGEDVILFTGMRGQDLYVSGEPTNTNLTPADADKNADGNVILVGQPYNFDLINHDSIRPLNAFNIHFEGTFFG